MKKTNGFHYHLACLIILLAVFAASCATNAHLKIGKVSEVGKYGDAITDITQSDFEAKGFTIGDIVKIKLNNTELNAPYSSSYQDVDVSMPIVMPSNGYITIAINSGDFVKTYDAAKETQVSFEIAQKAGYLIETNNKSVETKMTNKREDYESDETFANFRRIVSGEIKANRLYRSSSPLDHRLGRYLYADDLSRRVGIKTVLNLSDSESEMKSYPYYHSSHCSTTNSMALSATTDFRSGDFNQKLGRGLRFLAMSETPWLICSEKGKERTGFVCMILSALCGANADELIADYMKTYENLYGVTKDSARYDSIAKQTIHKQIMFFSKTGTIDDARKCNLAEAAANYLKENAGLNDTNIKVIRNRLCR